MIGRPLPALILYGGAGRWRWSVLFVRLPTAFLPVEDQGSMIGLYTLPVGATQSRTVAVGKQIEHYFLVDEKKNIEALFTVAGFNFGGNGQNLGLAFIHLSDWKDRPGAENSATAIAQRATRALSQQVRDGQVFILVPPAVPGLGSSSGFDLELEDRAGLGHDAPDGGAEPAAGAGGEGPAPRWRAAQQPARHAAAAPRHRPGQGRRAGPQSGRHRRPPSPPPGAAPSSTTSSTAAG